MLAERTMASKGFTEIQAANAWSTNIWYAQQHTLQCERFSPESFCRRGMSEYPACVSGSQASSTNTSRSGQRATILAKSPVLSSPRLQNRRTSFLRKLQLTNRSSRSCAASSRLQMMNECSAGATVNTCQVLFYQHHKLCMNKTSSIENMKCLLSCKHLNVHCMTTAIKIIN